MPICDSIDPALTFDGARMRFYAHCNRSFTANGRAMSDILILRDDMDRVPLRPGAPLSICGGNLWACRSHFEHGFPRIDAWLRPLETGSDPITAMPV